jgi:tRNA threonylcarbamoyladenosine biosynthesis protein TsaB
MRVLAADTSTPRGSVALVEGAEVRGEVRFVSESHSGRLLPAIAFLLETLNVAPQSIEGYAVTIGPGSFTGLRVGLSTIQGLALAAGRPVLGLSTLDVLAARVVGEADHVIAMMDAFRGQVFTRHYDRTGRPLGERTSEAPEALLARVPQGALCIGDGVERYADLLRARPDLMRASRSLFLAGTLGRLAGPPLAAGAGQEPAALRADYVRPPDIRGGRPV